MNWYKKAQEVYRGDAEPINLEDYDPEYAIKELGKELGSASAWGPGIYFVTQEDIAQMYGANITKRVLHNTNILTMESPLLNYQQIDKILQGVNTDIMQVAISNWDEDYNRGKRMLIESIVDADSSLDQLMNIWADIFSHQNPNSFIELMVKNGIDGISITKDDAIYYVIYNRNVLK